MEDDIRAKYGNIGEVIVYTIKSLSVDNDQRARSLVRLERPAHNRAVAGSNPAGPISYLNYVSHIHPPW